MLCLSAFELYSRWVPLFLSSGRIAFVLGIALLVNIALISLVRQFLLLGEK